MSKKIQLYIVSLLILFLLVIIASVDIPVYCGPDAVFVGWKKLITPNNVIAALSFIFIILGLIFHYRFNKKLGGSPTGLPIKVNKVENINYEYVSLFMTLLAIMAFDFTTLRGVILFIIVICILGIIFIKTELFYSNPSFALMGFYIYRVHADQTVIIPDNSILISNGQLTNNSYIDYLKISENVFFCHKINDRT